MKIMIITAAVAVLISGATASARTESFSIDTTGQLYWNCSQPWQTDAGAHRLAVGKKYACMNFINGVVYTHGLIFVRALSSAGFFCIPATTANEQIRLAVIHWLKTNPAKWQKHGPADSVISAFVEAFPCGP